MTVEEMLIAAALCLTVLAFALIIYLQKQTVKLRLKVEALTVLVKESDKQRDAVKRELQELRSGTIGVGRRMLELEKKLAQQDAKLEESSQQDPQARLYSRAMKMVALGAGVEELIQECELPKAEAELLIRLHGKN
ncbi:DUF2802 domain-containing protein [Shewanella fidelis]|uniref:DUF2802 domain-containing protein n=1 Tax=Shewanella fidelis TaxID=173509 RepID=A0AAW8NMG2_9GAMM|nr:DUF2802 domain-containing protein [Shewanella fidelis]MDR8524444.1 DUF2802 domain-containing protein [Shewanella fidelis]MDW4811920.1 DUF2802 domain-containing protein [Shewanella fidelis]MDW4817141.1 DUF2802 domain-containing protein [Shewanella fidelis]MDW4821211.1 DUF2802 domain-containing protein [Shewanella fidelis]MDW4822526.1 DUF2802 domain-containing protein [Shewanella fidelis]